MADESTFDRHFNRLMLVAAASVLGGGAIGGGVRLGTDKLADEVTKLREVMGMVVSRVDNIELREAKRDLQVQDHERRISTVERRWPTSDGKE